MTRKWGTAVRAFQKEHVKAREALERAWHDRIEVDDSLAELVTGGPGRAEPFHRWLPFRQQFAPGLVRRFLDEAGSSDPVLDPFSGSGTVAIECARAGRRAVAAEAIPVLAWLIAARLRGGDRAIAADVLAAARTVTGEGRRKAAAAPPDLLAEVAAMIAEDDASPLPPVARVVVADARRLPLAAASVGGVLTSPPYLSRYDYPRITAAMDAAWRRHGSARAPSQMRATLSSRPSVSGRAGRREGVRLPDAAEEAVAAVRKLGRPKDAGVIRAYFDDLMEAFAELHRVTKPGAPAWIVIGAADFQREYVPADLIAAELGGAAGFEVAGVVEARRLRRSERRLGGLEGVSPRESIVKLVKPVT